VRYQYVGTDPAINEYQIKAVSSCFISRRLLTGQPMPSPLRFSMVWDYGDDPFGAYLDEVVRGEKVNDRAMVVQRYRNMDEVKTCHILFISRPPGRAGQRQLFLS